MNIYGESKRTETHVITNWTDGARVYAHAKPANERCGTLILNLMTRWCDEPAHTDLLP